MDSRQCSPPVVQQIQCTSDRFQKHYALLWDLQSDEPQQNFSICIKCQHILSQRMILIKVVSFINLKFPFVPNSKFLSGRVSARVSSSSSSVSSGWENNHSIPNSMFFTPTYCRASSALNFGRPISTIIEIAVSFVGGSVNRASALLLSFFTSTPEEMGWMTEMIFVMRP